MSESVSKTEDCIVYFENREYNVGSFLDLHPGGRSILEKYREKDITKPFYSVQHSDDAREIMKKYEVKQDGDGTEGNSSRKSDRKTNLSFVVSKLFTHEDPFYFHKVFGFLAVCSFAYRYFYVFPTRLSLGFEDRSFFNFFTLFVHSMLSVSSLIFHVLERRMLRNPLIIYEEYRLHAIIFTIRSVAISLIGMYLPITDLKISQLIILCIMLAVHLAVDWITLKFGTKGVTAVRNAKEKTHRFVRYFFSFYQFVALAAHLIYDEKMYDLGFNALIAIQSSAFLMTLKRKNIIRWYSHLFWYGLALVLSMVVFYQVKGVMFFVIVGAFFGLRVAFDLNKYILWAFYSFCHYQWFQYIV